MLSRSRARAPTGPGSKRHRISVHVEGMVHALSHGNHALIRTGIEYVRHMDTDPAAPAKKNSVNNCLMIMLQLQSTYNYMHPAD